MSNYRRMRHKGGSYFFTVNLADRRSRLLIDRIDALREAVRQTQRERPFGIDAMVVMPNHLHAVWSLPAGDADFSTRWGAIKARFTRRVGLHPSAGPGQVGWKPTPRSASKVAKKEGKVWQRRFWEHCIRDEAEYRACVAYCWTNPVKHGFVAGATQWPYSSIHRDIRRGLVGSEYTGVIRDPVGWGSTPPPPDMRKMFGEE
jgi:putative transposase